MSEAQNSNWKAMAQRTLSGGSWRAIFCRAENRSPAGGKVEFSNLAAPHKCNRQRAGLRLLWRLFVGQSGSWLENRRRNKSGGALGSKAPVD